MQQDSYTIKGVVLDNNNQPLIGATVSVSGTTVGVVTDVDGNYTLKIPASAKNIEVSYMGYKTITMKFNPKSLGDFRVITLYEDETSLEEVTVVAFAKQKKNSVLGSVTTIKPAELKTTSSNLTTGFAGKLAGVIAYQRSGETGTG